MIMLSQSVLANKSLQFFLVLCLAACWLVQDNYTGLHGDSLLYSFQAFSRLMPGNFRHDLFTEFGGQSSYSFFPLLYVPFLSILGLEQAALALTFLGMVAWFIGLLCLARRLGGKEFWIFCLAGVVFVSPSFEGFGILKYAEPNLTPRIFAEALCLFAVPALWDRRYVASGILTVCAGILHPLMAILMAVVWGLMLLTDCSVSLRLRLSVLLAGVVVACVLALRVVGVDAMKIRLDAEWIHVIDVTSNAYLLADYWSFDMLCKPVYFLLVFGLATQQRLIDGARVLWCLMAVMVLLLGIWIAGSAVLRNAFLTQLQLWRGLWLVQIVAIVVNVRLLATMWCGSGPQRWGAAFMTLALCSLGVGGMIPTPSAALFMALAGWLLSQILRLLPDRYLEPRTWRLLPLVIIAPLCVSYVLSSALLQSVAVLVLFYVLFLSVSSRCVLAAACALLAIGLAPLAGEELRPLAAALCFFVWLIASDHDHPYWVHPVARILLALALLILLGSAGQETLVQAQKELDGTILAGIGMRTVAGEILTLLICLIAYVCLRRQWRQSRNTVLIPMAGLIPLVAALGFWMPSQAQMSTYQTEPWIQELQRKIPINAVVFSDHGVDWGWFALHRSFYQSHVQLFGAAFSRRNAIEGFRRRKHICNINIDFCKHTNSSIAQSEITHRLTRADIRRICSDPVLDFMVLRGVFQDNTGVVLDASGQPNSLIACARLRLNGKNG